jgi:NAD(P)-dependent dehydrogenase (short-subunit alcohol dehydrogenase family)
MMGSLSGKVAIVTGAGQGVGQGIAFALAKAGASIVVSGRTEAKLHSTVDTIAGFGGRAAPVVADVNQAADLKRLVSEALARFGGIDILVNNAQEVPLGPLLAVEDDAFMRGFTSGPLATLRLMKLCHPHMKARGGGSIINLITAAAVRWDMSNYGAYGAVKQATRTLTRAAASEWGRDNIRVNNIAPHALSPGMEGWIKANPEESAAFIATIPLGRLGDCEQDIGRAVLLMVSSEASYLTGATIPLDGGQANFD